MRAKDVPFSLPTIYEELPVIGHRERVPGRLEIHEDDWRRVELFHRSVLDIVLPSSPRCAGSSPTTLGATPTVGSVAEPREWWPAGSRGGSAAVALYGGAHGDAILELCMASDVDPPAGGAQAFVEALGAAMIGLDLLLVDWGRARLVEPGALGAYLRDVGVAHI